MEYREDAICPSLKLLIHVKGLSQAEVSERSGINGSQISKYVNGHRVPSHKTLGRLLAGIGADMLLFSLTLYFVSVVNELSQEDTSARIQAILRQVLLDDADAIPLSPEARQRLQEAARPLLDALGLYRDPR